MCKFISRRHRWVFSLYIVLSQIAGVSDVTNYLVSNQVNVWLSTQLYKFLYVIVYLPSCLCQVCPSGGRRAALSPGSSASGSFTVRCGQTGAQLHHLRHHSRLQDGTDVHVRSLSGEMDGVQMKRCLWMCRMNLKYFFLIVKLIVYKEKVGNIYVMKVT